MKLVKSRKFMIALIFTIFMTGFFWITANSDPASAVSVTVQAEGPNNNFLLTPRVVDVTAGYAESFTGGVYTNNSPATSSDVTVMDVLFKAHKDLYGDAFNSDTYGQYIGGESTSYLNKIFGFQGGTGYAFPALMFAVNGVQPHDTDPNHSFPAWGSQGETTGYMTYAINQSVVSAGDVVNLFFINSYNDLYTLINDGTTNRFGLNPLTDIFYSTDTIYLKAYDIFSEGYLDQSAWNIVSLSNAKVCKVSDGSVVATAGNDGSVVLGNSQLESGYNYLTVKPPTNSTANYIPIYFIVYKF